MTMIVAALISTSLLLLAPGVLTDIPGPYLIRLVVYNSITTQPNQTYQTEIAYRGVLLGAMTRLQMSQDCFKFTTKPNTDYGPYLDSVNGLAEEGNKYWELLIQHKNGVIVKADVGIGCYIPDPDDRVIFKYTTF